MYNPVTGEGCVGSRTVTLNPENKEEYVPDAMLDDPQLHLVRNNMRAWKLLRVKYDFEFWAVTCVKIKDKLSGMDIPFRLNAPQRRVLALIESQRTRRLPIRIIMLKARQWGGSTLIQMVMAWIQCVHHRNWNSLICAHVKDTAATIRGMYTKMLASYPEDMWTEEAKPQFKPFERSVNTRIIHGRGCKVTVGSSESQDAVRGLDCVMAHLSEVAFWTSGTTNSPEGLIRAVCGSIARVPDSLIVLESTANGVGNFFHSEWLRAERGESDKLPVFVPWYEIEIYKAPVADPDTLLESLDDYERGLLKLGCSPEQIQWYRDKLSEYPSRELMAAEYPTTPAEAFTNTGRGVFSMEKIEALREGCREPKAVGELSTGGSGYGALTVKGFVPDSKGCLKVWSFPDRSCRIVDRYVVAVDIGGRSTASDFSVIAVIDRCGSQGLPEVVAQWRGHIDHDLLTWKAASIAQWYGEALLVIESNTLESENTEGEHGLFILSELNSVYHNLYRRRTFDKISSATEDRIGFHTNRATKSLVINNLIGAIREQAYIERDAEACNELTVYEVKPSGSFAAREGCHDDIVMTRAIALYVAMNMGEPVPVAAVRCRKLPKFSHFWRV